MKLDNYLLVINEKNEVNNYKEDICVYGIGKIIQLIYEDLKNQKSREIIKLLESLGIKYQTLYSWKTEQNPIALSKLNTLLLLWKKECKKTKEESDRIWERVYFENKGYSQNSQRKILLPRELNEKMGYLIGFFQGDGHLKKERRFLQENSLYFYEGNLEMITELNKLIEEIFATKGNVYEGKNKRGHWYVLRICSKPIYFFFREILGLQSGRKTRNVGVPKIIKKSELSVQFAFIRGFFDAEGTIGENNKGPWLEMGQASKDFPCEILIWIQKKLKENGINLSIPKRTKNQEFFRIRTAKRESIKRFFEIISSNHPNKIKKFNNIIKR
ncbi:MAG: LAGLIDADG family homing endonuclease [Nanoarchaeota archaeon]